jgi:N6-L-threonylcarbamoyladenine synthase
VVRHLRENDIQPVTEGSVPSKAVCNLAASFQRTVVRSLTSTIAKVAGELRPRTLIVAGGVACNLELRAAAEKAANNLGIPAYFPSKHLSTDNAAMIAAAGHAHLMRGEFSDLSMTADVTMRLQNFENEDAALKKRGVHYKL